MKRRIVVLISFFMLFVFAGSTDAQGSYSSEHIEDFQQTTIINTDGTIDVTEKITYDFGTDQRHGIFRIIPYTKLNKKGKKFKMTFENFSVVDQANQPYRFTKTDESRKITLKIGDPDTTITGKHVYIIRYIVSGALTYFSDHDELYWNVTGNEWDVPIAKTSSTIQLPRTVLDHDVNIVCYEGKKGSTNQCVSGKVGNMRVFESSDLDASEGMTVVVGFPKGHVAVLAPILITDFFETFMGRLVIIGLMIVGFLWYIAYPLWLPIKWWREGRDPKQISSGVVRAWFDPPKKDGRELTPAETGTLIDEHVNIKELAALIIHLAQRGYLQIVEKKKKEFVLVKHNSADKADKLLPFEKHFLTKVFKHKTHVSLKKSSSFRTAITSVTDDIYKQIVKDGFFPKDPDKVRKKYSIIVGVAAFTFNIFLAISAAVFGELCHERHLMAYVLQTLLNHSRTFLNRKNDNLHFKQTNK